MRRRAVSLLEIVIAVLVLGIVAALTLPQLGRAASAPDEGLLLRERLQVLRVAIERYYQDHRAFPGQQTDGVNAAGTAAALVTQLTQYTDELGHAAASRDAQHRFGPYLRDGLPACPVVSPAAARAVALISGTATPGFQESATEAGWVYNFETGQVAANSRETDSAGCRYGNY
jgi:type II secretory pathway pseudopilin PulG